MPLSPDRLTRQGVRDLNPRGYNGHRKHGSTCRHNFNGPSVVIGHEWVTDPFYWDSYQREVYGKRCVWCGAIREERE